MLFIRTNNVFTPYSYCLYALFMIHNFMCLKCPICVRERLYEVSDSKYNGEVTSIYASSVGKRLNMYAGGSMLPISLFNASECLDESEENRKASQDFCKNVYHKNSINDEVYADSSIYSDTLDYYDSVKNQYQKLPYPAVSEKMIHSEQDNYSKGRQSMPYHIYHSIALEPINHFLFEGSNDFR